MRKPNREKTMGACLLPFFWIGFLTAAELPEPAEPISGSLVICGGGQLPERIQRRFVQLAGGDKARIVVIPTAAAGADSRDGETALKSWKSLGAAAVTRLHTRDRAMADTDEFVAPLLEATGVWIEGGQQTRLAEAYLGTAAEQALKDVLGRGGVVGGTSAGAAVMSGVMIESGNPRPLIGRGFGLLPGAIVDQHFLKRNRVARLFDALSKYPGLVGLGVDEGTALVVRGRELTVIGESYVVVCLPASESRTIRFDVMRDGARADLVALSRAAIARAKLPHPRPSPPAPHVEHGTLVIVGGWIPDVAIERFVDAAGGPEALIAVIPTALGGENPVDRRMERRLRRAGAENIRSLHAANRHEASRAEFLAALSEVRGIWFSGGRQWRLVDAYLDTPAQQAMHDVLARGGAIGGSSAGATIQASYLVRGNPLGNREMMAEGYERGLGFLEGVAIDQHFAQRNRYADMTLLKRTHPQLLGLGIDEQTAVVVRGHVMEVVGEHGVAVYDAAEPAVDGQRDYRLLADGDRYDLHSRRPDAPNERPTHRRRD
jgi:cyanophycinase